MYIVRKYSGRVMKRISLPPRLVMRWFTQPLDGANMMFIMDTTTTTEMKWGAKDSV